MDEESLRGLFFVFVWYGFGVSEKTTNIYRDAGRPGSYHGIAYVLDKNNTKKLSRVREDIKDVFGENIILAPDGTLHVTIMHITSDVSFYQKNKRLYESTMQDIVNGASKFEIKFRAVESSKDAIILRGYDNGSIENIRGQLSDLPTKTLKSKNTTFIHSTQARYKRKLPLRDVERKVSAIKVDQSIVVDSLSIVRANIAFTEPHEILGNFSLQ